MKCLTELAKIRQIKNIVNEYSFAVFLLFFFFKHWNKTRQFEMQSIFGVNVYFVIISGFFFKFYFHLVWFYEMELDFLLYTTTGAFESFDSIHTVDLSMTHNRMMNEQFLFTCWKKIYRGSWGPSGHEALVPLQININILCGTILFLVLFFRTFSRR
jgi:hypothetical protein